MLRIVPYSALYMTAYERYRRLLVDLRFMGGLGRQSGRWAGWLAGHLLYGSLSLH